MISPTEGYVVSGRIVDLVREVGGCCPSAARNSLSRRLPLAYDGSRRARSASTGTVLGQFSLSDGSALLLATEEWLTPKGRLIWHQGIAPDVQVTLPQGTSALHPEAEAGMAPEQVQNSGDAQLLQVLEFVHQSASRQPER